MSQSLITLYLYTIICNISIDTTCIINSITYNNVLNIIYIICYMTSYIHSQGPQSRLKRQHICRKKMDTSYYSQER